MLLTEFDFSLPCGFVDAEGVLHKEGLMRLATGADEILPQSDPRVKKNPAYLTVIVLSRVITRLGSVPLVNPGVIEQIYAKDLAYLQELYNTVNGFRPPTQRIACPECHKQFDHEAPAMGESAATP